MASSSEILRSGQKKDQEKSNFSQTCNLFSRYLKQNGNLGNLNLGMPETYRQPSTSATMNLFPVPVVEKPVSSLNSMNQIFSKTETEKKKSEPEKAQMTIFYGGQVIVFNDFPAEKANELMLFATKGNIIPNFTPKTTDHNANLTVPASPNLVQRPPQPTTIADLPIARKASLHRFLEKRKDRITAKAPYQLNNSSTSKTDESKPWLGLSAAQFGQQLQ